MSPSSSRTSAYQGPREPTQWHTKESRLRVWVRGKRGTKGPEPSPVPFSPGNPHEAGLLLGLQGAGGGCSCDALCVTWPGGSRAPATDSPSRESDSKGRLRASPKQQTQGVGRGRRVLQEARRSSVCLSVCVLGPCPSRGSVLPICLLQGEMLIRYSAQVGPWMFHTGLVTLSPWLPLVPRGNIEAKKYVGICRWGQATRWLPENWPCALETNLIIPRRVSFPKVWGTLPNAWQKSC